MELHTVIQQCEDHLFPGLRMNIRERGLYYHLFRHTRLLGKKSGLFALVPLANALNISESTVRDDVRALSEKGCIRIEERSRNGHLIRVFLPEEIDGVVPKATEVQNIDIESVDFFTGRKFLSSLFARENGACFYCLRTVRLDTCELDHVVSRAERTDHSYRNVVVSCHECNTTKQSKPASDFLRGLYRKGVLSQSELEERLSMLERLQNGQLVPDLSASSAI